MSEILRRVRLGWPLDHIPVIDVHTHSSHSSGYYHVPRADGPKIAAVMDRFGIDRIVTFGLNPTDDVATKNRDVYTRSRQLPDRFLPLTILHAGFPDDWSRLLEEGAAAGSRGIKIAWQYQGVPSEGPDWSSAFDFAKGRGWIVLCHHWGTPENLRRYAGAFPDVTFLVGHPDSRYASVVIECPNVYQCTAAAFVNPFSIEGMARALPIEKILHGSDALDLDFGTSIGPIAWADLPEEDKERILGRNAVALMERLGWNNPATSVA